MGRIGYRKSRNGCILCKKRRVKLCDEQRPCGACHKNGVECSLVNPNVAIEQKQGPQKDPSSSRTRSRRKINPKTNGPSPGARPSREEPEFPSWLDFDGSRAGILDLELMHHWTTVTSNEGSVPLGACRVFGEDLPRLGLRFPYLLHQILAMAAFHIVHKREEPCNEYVTRGSQHQSFAISGMRKALAQEEITQENSAAIAMTSSILMSSTFASHMSCSEQLGVIGPSSPLDALLEIINLQRGLSAIVNTSTHQLANHPIQALFDQAVMDTTEQAPQPILVESLRSLRTQLRSSAAQYLDEHETVIAESAIDALFKAMELPLGPRIVSKAELRAVFVWPSLLSEEFLGALQARSPSALTVFVWYAVLLRHSEPDCWYFKGWAEKLVDSISPLISYSPWTELTEGALTHLRQPSTSSALMT